jgi:hypothetical protein
MDELLQEDRIEQLMQELETFPELATAANDLDAQRKLYSRMREIDTELKTIRSRQQAALNSLIEERPSVDPDGEAERITRLLRAFEFAAQLGRIAGDVICDSQYSDQWTEQRKRIVTVLDGVDPGRLHLIGLLDHPIADVRAAAGAYVMEVAPERALPVLRAVCESEDGLNAGWTAYWPLRMYEGEQKKKKES